jgi:hypothetical protein
MKFSAPVFSSLLSCVALAVSAQAQTPAATDLFNGKDLTGWSLVTPDHTAIAAVCHVTAEGAMAVAGKPVGYLLADGTYKNYQLHVEWRWPADAVKNSNSGVLVHIASGPIDRNTWPLCFQVQNKITRAGDLIPMGGAKFAEALSTAPGAVTPQLYRQHKDSSEKPLGEWNTCDIVCRDGVLECAINGVAENRVTGCQPAAGQIGIQLEGFPYELRNIRIAPLP